MRDPALRAKGKRVAEIHDAIRELAANMLETMRGANGIGLAAQQVGQALQLTVVDISAVEDRPSSMAWNGKEVDPKEQMPLVLLLGGWQSADQFGSPIPAARRLLHPIPLNPQRKAIETTDERPESNHQPYHLDALFRCL